MKMIKKMMVALILVASVFAGNVVAGHHAVTLAPGSYSLAYINQNELGHMAGNFELDVHGTFAIPSDWTCSNRYIATKKSGYSDWVQTTLMAGITSGRTVSLFISNDAQYQAYPGRCSIVAAILK